MPTNPKTSAHLLGLLLAFLILCLPSVARAQTLDITMPNAATTWARGTTQTISWDSTGLSSTVRIQLYKGSVYHSTIADSTDNDGSYSWAIPSTLAAASDYKIRMFDGALATYNDITSGFTIEPGSGSGSITVTSPTANSTLTYGTLITIAWTSSDLQENVSIDLYKGSTKIQTIATSTANDGSYSWTVDDSIEGASNYKIRIASVFDAGVYDDSGLFTIAGMAVTAPAKNETWYRGRTHLIKWEGGSGGNVRLDLFKDGVYNTTITTSTADDGQHDWGISFLQDTGSYQVYVTDLNDQSNSAYSESFTIAIDPTIEPTLNLTNPTGGEQFVPGTTYNLTWTSANLSADWVRLYVEKNGAYAYGIIDKTPDDGIHEWTVPTNIEPDNTYKIVIHDRYDPYVMDTSGFVTISTQSMGSPIISVSKPASGDKVVPGASTSVTWTSQYVEGGMDFVLYKNGTYQATLATNRPNTGSYTWNVSASLPEGSGYTVRVLSHLDNSVYGTSGSFSVDQDGDGGSGGGDGTVGDNATITLTNPTGGETFKRGTTKTISWSSSEVDSSVTIQLSKGSFSTWTIAEYIDNDGSYDWYVDPDLIVGENYVIRILATADASVNDRSDNFTISDEDDSDPSITVSSPVSGQSYTAGTTLPIAWSSQDVSGTVDIFLDAGGESTTIASSTQNDGSHSYIIPAETASLSGCKVRVVASEDENVYGSSGSFEITAKGDGDGSDNGVTVTAPTSGATWQKGETQLIAWSAPELTGPVKITLINGPFESHELVGSTPNDGAYEWTPGEELTTDSSYQIRIVAAEDATVSGSSGYFTLASGELERIDVISPSEGAVWKPGESRDIVWNASGVTGQVYVKLSYGSFQTTILAQNQSASGSYTWTIPANQAEHEGYEIRVISHSDASVNGASGLFDISSDGSDGSGSGLTVTAPEAGAELRLGGSATIRWTTEATSAVDIELVQGGETVAEIATGQENTGSYNWSIPEELTEGDDYSVRVRLADYADVAGASSTFALKQSVTTTLLIPHLTGPTTEWNDILQIDNPTQANAKYTLTLYQDGAVVLSKLYAVKPMSYTALDLKAELAEVVGAGATADCGEISHESPDLAFRISHENTLGGGVAEFALPERASASLAFLFANESSFVNWKGMALMNAGAEETSVSLTAHGGGQILGEKLVTVPAKGHLSAMHDVLFPGVDVAAIEKITAQAAENTLAGITITGSEDSSSLLFARAQDPDNVVCDLIMPHLTGGDATWSDYLEVDSLSAETASYTVVLYKSGQTLAEKTYEIAPGEFARFDLATVAEGAEDADSGMVRFTDCRLTFRLAYENVSGGVASFRLTGDAHATLSFPFANFAELVSWKGLALYNTSSSTRAITLYAMGGGAVLGFKQIEVPARGKIVGVHTSWFDELALEDVELIVAEGDENCFVGLAISGDASNKRMLFGSAGALEEFGGLF